MKVILTEKVRAIGNVGDVANVSAGHARNFLIPKKLAVIANKSGEKFFQNQRKKLSKKIEEERAQALELKKKIEGVTIELQRRVAGNGKLFGNVSAMDLSKSLLDKEIDVEKRAIIIDKPIKQLGKFEVKAKLFNDVEALFHVVVEMDLKQKKEIEDKQLQAKKKSKMKAEKVETVEEENTLDDSAESVDSAE